MELIMVARVHGVGLKQHRSDAEHTLPFKAEAENEWSCSTTFQNTLMICKQNIAFSFAAIFLNKKSRVLSKMSVISRFFRSRLERK